MQNTKEILALLKKHYPNAEYYLEFKNPLNLLVGAILSAQARDEVVNETMLELSKKYKNASNYTDASLEKLTKDFGHINFAGTKAKHIKEACRILVKSYNGKIPSSKEELIKLPGIGKKTANVILINAFNKIVGIPVDTHVQRLSCRLGWTKQNNPDKTEQDLLKIIPKDDWKEFPWLLKSHGKAICKAPEPYCSRCFLSKLCPKKGVKKQL